MSDYTEASRLLRSCQLIAATDDNAAIYAGIEEGVDTTTHALMAAQVHATLAQVEALTGIAHNLDVISRGLDSIQEALNFGLPGRKR